jgi:hypothetical protein
MTVHLETTQRDTLGQDNMKSQKQVTVKMVSSINQNIKALLAL